MVGVLFSAELDPRQAAYVDTLVERIAHAPQPPAPRFVNPFAPPPERAASRAQRVVPPPVLHSIVGSRALINGAWVQSGDRVAGYEVVAITVGSVELKRGSQVLHLRIRSASDRAILMRTEGL